jgi:hypothetical protein
VNVLEVGACSTSSLTPAGGIDNDAVITKHGLTYQPSWEPGCSRFVHGTSRHAQEQAGRLPVGRQPRALVDELIWRRVSISGTALK